MAQKIWETHSRAWWAMGAVFFLALELALRIKLGSIFALAIGWGLVHEWARGRVGLPSEPDPNRRLLFALFAPLIICAVIFAVFAVLNIGLRTINNDWRWFQLP